MPYPRYYGEQTASCAGHCSEDREHTGSQGTHEPDPDAVDTPTFDGLTAEEIRDLATRTPLEPGRAVHRPTISQDLMQAMLEP